MKTVSIIHSSDSQGYTYKVTDELYDQLAPQDLVVTKNRMGYALGRVVVKHKKPDIKPGINYAWAFQRVDTDAHQQLLDAEMLE